jgi:hypothetical protein
MRPRKDKVEVRESNISYREESPYPGKETFINNDVYADR